MLIIDSTDKSFFTFQQIFLRRQLACLLQRRDGNTSWTNFKLSAVIKVLENLTTSPLLSDLLIGQDAGHTRDLLRVQQTYRGSVHHEGRRLHPPRAVSQVGKLNSAPSISRQIKEWELFLQSEGQNIFHPASKIFGRDPSSIFVTKKDKNKMLTDFFLSLCSQ